MNVLMKRLCWVLVVAIIGYVAFLWLSSYSYGALSYSRAVSKQNVIVDAYLNYKKGSGRFASSIEEIVSAGYLPEYGDFYVEPEKDRKNKKRHYSESTFKIFPMKEDFSNVMEVIGHRVPGSSDYEFFVQVNVRIRDSIPEMAVHLQAPAAGVKPSD